MFQLSRPPVSAFNTGTSKRVGVKGLSEKTMEIPMLSQNKRPTIVMTTTYTKKTKDSGTE